MTNEQAVKILRRNRLSYDEQEAEQFCEAYEMAISALEQEPCFSQEKSRFSQEVSQEPCDDAISREELLKAIDTWDKFGCDADTKLVRYQDHYIPYIHYDDVIKCIKGMPSVTQKSGKWEYVPQDEGWYICSECRCGNDYADNFCPQCGAKMESEVQE